jgi:hypothetical protein
MPLRDHFHPPLSELRHWESFHSRWAAVIADTLEAELLPPGYFAEVQIHVGNRVEVDIASFEEAQNAADQKGNGAVAVAAKVWTLPAPAMIMPAIFPDRLEVLIFQTEAGPTLVAAIELVSPRNKDRKESRQAFAIKCANYLRHGIGLVVVDVVTNRKANLHNEMVGLLELGEAFLLSNELYAIAYRPAQHADENLIQVWPHALSVGEELPVVPLPLDKGQFVRLDLDATYAEACGRMRLPAE